MLLSGLTLAVSAAGFIFLHNKISKINDKLDILLKEVKEVRAFLQSQEQAALEVALKTLSNTKSDLDDNIRIPILLQQRQILAEINQRYNNLLLNVSSLEEFSIIEEYFSVTALAHSLCSAELDMHSHAVNDLNDSFKSWQISVRRIARDKILRKDPERFLECRYAKKVQVDEIIDWMDFVNNENKNLKWIDDFRQVPSYMPSIQRKLFNLEDLEVKIMKKMVARNRIYSGYVEQHKFISDSKLRPSQLQGFFEGLPNNMKVNDCFILIAK